MSPTRKKAYFALLTTSLLWGLAPTIIKYSLNLISPITFLYYRFLIVSLILIGPLVWKLLHTKINLKIWLTYLALGFLGTPLTLLFLFYGIERTSAINSSIVSLFNPILIIIGGVIFLKEKVNRAEKVGLAFVVTGALLNAIAPFLLTGLSFSGDITGNLLIILSAICWTTFSLWRSKEGEKLDSFILTASSFVLGLLVLLPLVSFNFSLLTFNLKSLWGILYMAIFGSVIAYFTYIYGFSKIEASEATVFSYLEPIFAIPASMIFLQEKTSFLFWIGAGLIITGVFLSEFNRRFQRNSQKSPSLDLDRLNKV
ncbi:MAG: DMT family transporter [Patescibacteria group bacterium]|nr:DMT family transporter [Patescibacteria group bacterium]